MTKDQIAEVIEQATLRDFQKQGESLTREDICVECRDRRCEHGRTCKEFLRRSKAYAWELASQHAELN